MDSRAAFKTIDNKDLRGSAEGTDTGFIPPESGYRNPGPTPNLRGVERNTARGVNDGAPMILGAPGVEYAAPSDQPIVDPYKVWEN